MDQHLEDYKEFFGNEQTNKDFKRKYKEINSNVHSLLEFSNRSLNELISFNED